MVCTYNSLHECREPESTFPATTSNIMVNANLENVVVGTTIGIQWIYQEGELDGAVKIADTTFKKPDESITSMYAILSRPDNGWPEGKYEVVLTSDESNVEPFSLDFSILAGNSSNAAQLTSGVNASDTEIASSSGSSKNSTSEASVSETRTLEVRASAVSPAIANPSAVSAAEVLSPSLPNAGKLLGNVTFCQLDAQGSCITEMVILPVTRAAVRVKANVANAPVGTTVEARWRYVKGSLGRAEEIQTISMTKNDDRDTWVQSILNKPRAGWPTGQYEVALRVVPNASDITVKSFVVR